MKLHFRRFLARLKVPRIRGVDRKTLAWCIAAVMALPVSLAVCQLLLDKALLNGTIISANTKVNKTLKQNLSNVKTLKSDVDKLLADESLAPLRASEGDNNFRVILDALPVSGDPATFATSLQGVILKRSGVTISKLSVTDADQLGTVSATTPQQLRFQVEITGDFAAIKAALGDIEKTIRPIHVTALILDQTSSRITAKITGVTYYLPEKTVKLQAKEVKRP